MNSASELVYHLAKQCSRNQMSPKALDSNTKYTAKQKCI